MSILIVFETIILHWNTYELSKTKAYCIINLRKEFIYIKKEWLTEYFKNIKMVCIKDVTIRIHIMFAI